MVSTSAAPATTTAGGAAGGDGGALGGSLSATGGGAGATIFAAKGQRRVDVDGGPMGAGLALAVAIGGLLLL